MRIVIAGGPRTGKTWLAADKQKRTGIVARHTDDLVDRLDWSAASAEVARWMAEPGPWVIEGVAAVRALRKALAASTEAPCDLLIVLTVPKVERTPGQVTMGKGVHTVLAEIRAELLARGATIEEGEAPPMTAPDVAQESA